MFPTLLPTLFRALDPTAGMAGGSASQVVIAAEGALIELPAGFNPAHVEYVHVGSDLILTSADGSEIIITNFYTSDPAPHLIGTDGARISGDLAARLGGSATPGQMAGDVASSAVIGRVSTLSGEVTVIHADGTRVTLQQGDAMYMGDILQTGAQGGVGILLADGTSLSMAEDGRMVLDEMVYDPATQEGSIALSVLEGVYTIVSGDVAKTDPDAMTITTPMATIGIRGTQLGIDLTGDAGLTVVLMEEADGFVGEVFIANDSGVITLNQAYSAMTVQSFNSPLEAVANFSRSDVIDTFGEALGFLPSTGTGANNYGQEAATDPIDEGFAEFDTAAGEDDVLDVLQDDVKFGEEIEAIEAIEAIEVPQSAGIIESPVTAEPTVTATTHPPLVSNPVVPPVVEGEVENAPPTAETGTVITAEDNTFSGQLVAADLEGGELTYDIAPQGWPVNGTVTINPGGTFTYTPIQDFGGSDTFTYLVTDDAGATATATITVNVTPVGDAPILTVSDVVIDLGEPIPGEEIEGTRHDDLIIGTSGSDVIDGDRGEDVIYGDPQGGGEGLPTSEDIIVALDVNSYLTDVDGSETLSLDFAAVPDGASFSVGTNNGDGTWSISGADLENLESLAMTVPAGTVPEDFSLDVTANAIETATGSTASSTGNIEINFTGGAAGEGAGDTIDGGQGDDQIYGGAGDDTIEGGQGDDTLEGGAGDDFIGGGKGDDVLEGGAGDDVLAGGKGEDTFVFRAGDGDDNILDLSEQDELRFEGPEFSAENMTVQNNADNTSSITFGDDAGVSVTLNDSYLDTGEGYTVTQDGDALVVTFDDEYEG